VIVEVAQANASTLLILANRRKAASAVTVRDNRWIKPSQPERPPPLKAY
jgi:hypothetical protein